MIGQRLCAELSRATGQANPNHCRADRESRAPLARASRLRTLGGTDYDRAFSQMRSVSSTSIGPVRTWIVP